jgi:hypothetical protein
MTAGGAEARGDQLASEKCLVPKRATSSKKQRNPRPVELRDAPDGASLIYEYNFDMQRRSFLTCTLLVFLTACVPSTATSSPTSTQTMASPATIQPTELPEVSATSFPPSETVSPTQEYTPTPAITPTLEPVITETTRPLPTFDLPPTMAATSIPQPSVGSGVLQIFSPGPQSKLVSPVTVYGYAIPGFNNRGRLSLFGEDGRLLDSKVIYLYTANTWAYFNIPLSYAIQGVGELARLTISTQDQYGRLTAVYSVHLILLSEGSSIINPPGDLKERCVIDKPVLGRRIAGGILTVAGEIRPFNSLPLVIELISRYNKIIASQLVTVSPAPDDSYVPFQSDLPYSISNGTWALLVVRQPDERIGGTMYLYSREVYLSP